LKTEKPVLIIGGGVAGLASALHLAPMPVLVIAHATLGTGASTRWAQGGLAAAIGDGDTPEQHAEDTIKAGAGLTDPAVALRVTKAAPTCIDWLISLAARFDRKEDGGLALGLEAAHSRRRIVRAQGDSTGREVLETLIRAARQQPSIRFLEGVQALELARDSHGQVAGVLCRREAEAPFLLEGRAVVLATGGVGGLYAHTTNPLGATGAGLAMAARIGAVLKDLEFVQFHPTAIATSADPMPLATEALRGEGAILVNETGERFLGNVPGAELAPRDVVARHIFLQWQRGGKAFLDARLIGPDWPRRFPTVHAFCLKAGIDPAQDLIPVRPAAHYHCGGIAVDENGRASVEGLWVCGEAACTGLHGANRLASNSLIEALAYSRWIGESLGASPAAGLPDLVTTPSQSLPEHDRRHIRTLMDEHVGLLRRRHGLEQTIAALSPLALHSREAQTALLITQAALARPHSLGSHLRED
jgi:L-aspartate oxidase